MEPLLAFYDVTFFKHTFWRKIRLLEKLPCLIIFVIRENEKLISVNGESQLFPPVKRSGEALVRSPVKKILKFSELFFYS